MAISGVTIVDGAPRDDSSQGSAYLFARNQGGADNWGQVKKLIASDGAHGDVLGYSVAISCETIVVGAEPHDIGVNANLGSAYVLSSDDGSWGEVKKQTASDGAGGDEFGWSVGISCDTIVVGAPFDDDNGTDSGSAYVFKRNQGGADNWGQVKKLTASDAAALDRFAIRVAIWGDTIVGEAHWADRCHQRSGRRVRL